MERQYDPIHPRGTDWRGLFRRIWAPVGAAIVLFAKFSFAAVKFFSIFIAVAGYALIKDAPLNPWRNALVSLAGPAYGGVGAAVCWAIGEANNSDLFRALAYAGFLINLINLIPIGILDGGSVWRAFQLARHSVEAPPGQPLAMGSTYPIAVPGGGPSRAVQIAALYGLLVTLLVLGM